MGLRRPAAVVAVSAAVLAGACGEDETARGAPPGGDAGAPGPGSGDGASSSTAPPKAACAAAGGGAAVSAPVLELTLKDRYEEAWLASPAVADLDGDGKNEIIVARGAQVVVWNASGSLKWKAAAGTGRIWSSPVVADLAGDGRLEVAVAARDHLYVFDATGAPARGFPVVWEDEMRALAAADLDGDGKLELLASTGHSGPTDVVNAWRGDGSPAPGFPPNARGVSGCSGSAAPNPCYLAGAYDQNLAAGDLDGDGKHDLVVPHDNAYASFHKGSGQAFDSAPAYVGHRKTPGVRYLHALPEAIAGFARDESTALQAHFTNTAPAIADLDGDGRPEIVLLASVQNAKQDRREQGVAVWAMHHDASRLAGWETPFHVPAYLAGLWDPGDNIVAVTNQVTVADIDPSRRGPEVLFAGFDGRVHAVGADRVELWSTEYTKEAGVMTGGVVVADLSADGSPEIVFATYATAADKGSLFILDAHGALLHRVPLPRRGAMPVPTVADVDGDGDLEIVVSLKDAQDKVESVRVYGVPGSRTNCLLWPTGRGGLLRSAWVR